MQILVTVVEQMNASGLKIVIVDDSSLIVSRLQQSIEPLAEIEVAGVAKDVQGAFNLIKESNPDVVILDIYLGDDTHTGNGLTLLPILSEAFPHIQVIMLTNLSGQQYRNKCMKMGARYFLDKSNEFERIPEILTDLAREIKSE
jgi:DNA-binding NarL/FixJ family response regulator